MVDGVLGQARAGASGLRLVAIETAFGVSAGVPPDPFFVGLGVLGLLAASARPLLCVVDDVQWLDQASARAPGFAARRLQADAVAVLLSGREADELAEVRLAGLADADERALLASVLPRWADQKVIYRIVAETAGNPLALLEGNPLALLELPRGMTPAELAGGPGFGGTAGLPGRIEESFRRRLEPHDGHRERENTRDQRAMGSADLSGAGPASHARDGGWGLACPGRDVVNGHAMPPCSQRTGPRSRVTTGRIRVTE